MKRILLFCSLAGVFLAGNGCTPKPVADFEFAAPTDPAPVTVQFTNTSENADRYEWDFGDGQTSAETSPSHTFTSYGNLLVVLKAFQKDFASIDSVYINIPEPPRRRAVIETEFGNMTIELSNRTPLHRDNFVKLAEQHFYDSLLFHRVISGFMIQGGDPDSRTATKGQTLGASGPGYTVPAEFSPELIHTKGALAAARLGDQINPEKASSGSQFYLVQGHQITEEVLGQLEQMRKIQYSPEQRAAYLNARYGAPSLDREYTVFGHVVEGLEVIDLIASQPTDPLTNRPLKDIRMKIRMIQ